MAFHRPRSTSDRPRSTEIDLGSTEIDRDRPRSTLDRPRSTEIDRSILVDIGRYWSILILVDTCERSTEIDQDRPRIRPGSTRDRPGSTGIDRDRPGSTPDRPVDISRSRSIYSVGGDLLWGNLLPRAQSLVQKHRVWKQFQMFCYCMSSFSKIGRFGKCPKILIEIPSIPVCLLS